MFTFPKHYNIIALFFSFKKCSNTSTFHQRIFFSVIMFSDTNYSSLKSTHKDKERYIICLLQFENKSTMYITILIAILTHTINICLILSTIYIFISVSGCVGRGP